jgi:hypothetical protein
MFNAHFQDCSNAFCVRGSKSAAKAQQSSDQQQVKDTNNSGIRENFSQCVQSFHQSAVEESTDRKQEGANISCH